MRLNYENRCVRCAAMIIVLAIHRQTFTFKHINMRYSGTINIKLYFVCQKHFWYIDIRRHIIYIIMIHNIIQIKMKIRKSGRKKVFVGVRRHGRGKVGECGSFCLFENSIFEWWNEMVYSLGRISTENHIYSFFFLSINRLIGITYQILQVSDNELALVLNYASKYLIWEFIIFLSQVFRWGREDDC